MEAVFKEFLPKHTHPFVYLDVEMPPQHVDVNVHPTKREVHFLFEDELILAAQGAVERVLAGGNQSRTFYTQALLPTAPAPPAGPSSLKCVAWSWVVGTGVTQYVHPETRKPEWSP